MKERDRRRDHEKDVLERVDVGDEQIDHVVGLPRLDHDLLAAQHRLQLVLGRRVGLSHEGTSQTLRPDVPAVFASGCEVSGAGGYARACSSSSSAG